MKLLGFAVTLAILALASAQVPVLSPVSQQRTFIEDGLSVRIGDALTVSGYTGTITQATATLSVVAGVPFTDEGLVADLGATGLSQNYDTASGVLTISGARTVATYTQVCTTGACFSPFLSIFFLVLFLFRAPLFFCPKVIFFDFIYKKTRNTTTPFCLARCTPSASWLLEPSHPCAMFAGHQHAALF